MGQAASDDELSPSDDERVLFKKSGEIELNLCPQTRIQRAKTKNSRCRYLALCGAIFVVVISLVTFAFVYGKTHSVKQAANHKVTDPDTSQLNPNDTEQGRGDNGWNITFKDMGKFISLFQNQFEKIQNSCNKEIFFFFYERLSLNPVGQEHTFYALKACTLLCGEIKYHRIFFVLKITCIVFITCLLLNPMTFFHNLDMYCLAGLVVKASHLQS